VKVRSEGGPSPTITVSDDGPGIDAAEVVAIFEPGRRGSAERSASSGSGTGLGLSLSRRLAQALGGDVEVISGPGDGACFRVSLRRAPG
jgi:signal transduction histidine kinase